MESLDKKSPENKIFITVDSNININGLSKDQVESLIICLRGQTAGYNYVKKQSFSEQKKTFLLLQPELSKLSSKDFRKTVEIQLSQGERCEEILTSLDKWQKSESKETEAKVVSLNK